MDKELAMGFIGILFVCALLAVVGNMTIEDELMEEKHYCNDVFNGLYPDYNGLMRNGICKKYEEPSDDQSERNATSRGAYVLQSQYQQNRTESHIRF
ncbi:hypothetical protein [Marinobacterium litorale]|uniref:hypothetical protein n=1 Tax=Marinobacterium litorale TaxID=404770 RepID=UPI000563CC1E|nr:hypothetical protein [Marinobacterium litorale]